MIHVPGRSMIVMDSVTDRMRLKDKIVANVAKAVKSIQELQILSGNDTITLTNNDWQCHRLCEHLDHSLLHGLRHITPGYWETVTQFTHKDCIKEIKRMRNVTTDLGRGRAWLFMALNESLLESYMRCYQQNEGVVEDYYVKDALVRDQDRFNVLLTLAAGLENIIFQLECDVPYLDLCVYPPKTRSSSSTEITVEFDKVSMCSMESVHFGGSSRPLPQAVFETPETMDKDTCSIGSEDSLTGRRHSPSIDSGVHSDWNYRQRSITPIIDQGRQDYRDDTTANSGELEVIRLTKKGKPHKHKKKKKRFISVSSIPDVNVSDIPEKHEGPVIEIPPIDDFKFESAIMNSQNNNTDADIAQFPSSDLESSWVSGVRMPGDGVDNSADDTDGRVSITKKTSAIDNDKDTKDIVEDTGSLNAADHVDSTAVTNRGCGTYTDIIKSRVDNIVDAGSRKNEQSSRTHCDNDRVRTESIHLSKDTREMNSDDKNSVQYNSEIDQSVYAKFLDSALDGKVHSDIYNAESVDEQVRNNQQVNRVKKDSGETDQKPKVQEEEPSIYSHVVSSEDENSADEFDKAAQELLQSSSHRKTPSQHSNSSTPSRSSNNTPSQLSRPNSAARTNQESDQSDLDRGTPDFITANKMRKASLSSKSFVNDADEERYGAGQRAGSRLSNRESPIDEKYASGQRAGSRMSNRESPYDERYASGQRSGSRLSNRESPNSQIFYRDSPCPSTDDEKQNSLTISNSLSSDPDTQKSEQVLQAKVEELIENRRLNTYTHLTFPEEEDLEGEGDLVEQRDRASSLRPGEVELDNNTMLYLMLDILDGEETFVKMFCCHLGHTEGKTSVVCVLISTNAIYILEHKPGKTRFNKVYDILFHDIDFVSLGSNNQTLHIACKNKRHKYWFTPGDERVTLAIVDCLAASMENCPNKPGKLEVDTDNLAQKLSLRKYIAKECNCDMDEAQVICYSLVHWEDPLSKSGSCESDREGNLYYKSNATTNILGTQSWRLAYAVLKDFMLCLYADRNDTKPTHFLSMRGDQCVGCKRDFNSDKNHSIRIMLADGTFWSIALETDAEANAWLYGLCQAVSEGLKMNPMSTSCMPCCAIMSHQKLLMCHEDLETNFVRTLDSVNLEDITAIQTDELHPTYIVLAISDPAQMGDGRSWVFYFNSDYECNKFSQALSQCWFDHYQVELPMIELEDFALQKKCRDMTKYMKSTAAI